MIAFLEAKRAGLFARQACWPNVVAGVIVGVVALPLAMAFAIASGARPEQGIYTSILSALVVSLFGGSRVQIAGPTGAFIAILAGITLKFGLSGLQMATLMAGVILIVFGVAKLGTLVKFIPAPVVVGFTAGIGVIIFVGQWPAFFGLPTVGGLHFHDQLLHLLAALPAFHRATLALALFSLGLVLFAQRLPGLRNIPGPLTAMLVATCIQTVGQFGGVATIGSAFGGIPSSLPAFHWPAFALGRVLELVGPAFSIALLGSIESLLSAVVADGMAGTRHDSNQELIGQGVANLVVPLFGGFAATGALARTATNIRNGATSPLAGVVHSLTLVFIVVVFAPWAVNIPLCALAAILFVVAYNMSDVKHFVAIVRRAPKSDVAVLLVTFLLTVFADLVVAVNIGVILAILQFLRRMSSSVDVHPVEQSELAAEVAKLGLGALPSGLLVYEIDGPFFFGAVESFERSLLHTASDPEILIIRMRHVPFVDLTGMQTLEAVVRNFQQRGVRVLLCEANARVEAKLRRAHVLDALGPNDYASSLSTLLKHLLAPAV